MKSNKLIILFALLSITSCGKDKDSSSPAAIQGANQEYIEASPGTYYSVLRPVNFQSNGFIPYGAATFKLKDDELQVNISLDDDQPVKHRQALHMGFRCPTLQDDTNGDGFVDYDEAERVVGPIIMSLDSDLNSEAAGAESFPSGRAMTYNKIASLQKINADLLSQNKRSIGLKGRVVLVHGTSPQTSFPTSLASYYNEEANLSLPIVCGVLEKVE